MGWKRVGKGRCKFGHGLGLHVAMLKLPLVVEFEQHGIDEADDGLLIREDADDIGAALNLLVDALDRVRGVNFGAVLGGEVRAGLDRFMPAS